MQARISAAAALLVVGFLVLAPSAAALARIPVTPEPKTDLRMGLSLLAPPSAPQNLDFTAITPSDATLSWQAPDDDGGGAIAGYAYTVLDEGGLDVASGSTDGGTTSIKVSGLVVGENYQASVTATNGGFQSVAATASYTPVIPIPGAPTNVSASISDNGDGSATVGGSWDAVAGATAYSVELGGSDGSGATSIVSGTTASFSVAADYHLSYTVTVTAENSTGDSGAVSSQAVALSPGLASAPLGVAVARDTGSNGFTVTWRPVADDGGTPITGYAVLIDDETKGGVAVGGTDTDPSTFSADFTGYTVGDRYDIQLWAINGQGGGARASVPFTLDALAPGAPQNVVLVDNGQGALEGRWDAPAYDGGTGVTGYAPVVTDGHGQRYFSGSDPSSNDVFFTVPTTAGETYTLSVAATNAAGTGVSATGNTVTEPTATAPGIPSFGDVEAVGYHDAAIALDWMPPQDGGSPITGYAVTLYDAAGTLLRTEQLGGDVDSSVLNGLANDTSYSVTIQATNDSGDSAASVPEMVTTLPLVPPAPLLQTIENGVATGVEATIQGTTIVAHVDTATPGSWVYGIVYSTPAILGWQQVDAAGDASWTLPALDPGIHHFAVLDGNGTVIGATPFVVAQPAPTTAPAAPGVTVVKRAVGTATTGAAPAAATVTAATATTATATTDSPTGDGGLLGGAAALLILGGLVAGGRFLHRDPKP